MTQKLALFVLAVGLAVAFPVRAKKREWVRLVDRLGPNSRIVLNQKKSLWRERFVGLTGVALDQAAHAQGRSFSRLRADIELSNKDAQTILRTIARELSERNDSVGTITSLDRELIGYFERIPLPELAASLQTYRTLWEANDLDKSPNALLQELKEQGAALIALFKVLQLIDPLAVNSKEWDSAYQSLFRSAQHEIWWVDFKIKRLISQNQELGANYAALLMVSLLAAPLPEQDRLLRVLKAAGPEIRFDVEANRVITPWLAKYHLSGPAKALVATTAASFVLSLAGTLYSLSQLSQGASAPFIEMATHFSTVSGEYLTYASATLSGSYAIDPIINFFARLRNRRRSNILEHEFKRQIPQCYGLWEKSQEEE